MAKAINKKDKEKEIIVDNDVQLVSPELENKLTVNNLAKASQEVEVGQDSDNEISIVQSEPVVTPVKMVKVLMKKDHKCCIGGEWYYLIKDKHYNVPDNVKDILLKADLLQPI